MKELYCIWIRKRHDLARPCLRDVVHEVDDLRIGYRAQDTSHMLGKDGLEIFCGLNSCLEDDEGHDHLALNLIWLANDGSLGNLGV